MRQKVTSHIDTYRFAVQTSHFTPAQAGEIFNLTKPRLAVIHHATVNDASREALVSDVSSNPAHLSVRSVHALTRSRCTTCSLHTTWSKLVWPPPTSETGVASISLKNSLRCF